MDFCQEGRYNKNGHMSGHSKWSQIKRQKEAGDIKKGQLFTKLASAITLAVRQGGGITDPQSNFKLRLAMEKARAANMPKENIQRAIERTKGGEILQLEEVIYEGYGPVGVALMVEAATDNRQRTTQEIKNILEKAGGSLGGPGSVSFQFKQMGMVNLKKNGKTAEEIFLLAAEAGAQDLEEAGNSFLIYTKPEELIPVKQKLADAGLAVEGADLTFKPTTIVAITDQEKAHKILNLMERLEEIPEVQHVFANFDIPDEFLT